MKRFLQQWGPLIIVLMAITFSLAPVMVRSAQDPLVPLGESYYNMRISQELQENPTLQNDPLQERPYNPNLYHYLLALLQLFLSDQGLIMSSIALSVASAFLLQKALRDYGMDERAILAVAIFILSPIYIYTSTTLTPYTLTLFLITLTLYLRNWSAAIPAGLTALTNPSVFLILTITMIIHNHLGEEKHPAYLTLGVGTILTGAAYLFLDYIPIIKLFNGGLAPLNYITDFGATVGYSFFGLLLAIVSILLFWKDDKKFSKGGVIYLLLLLTSTTLEPTRLLINIITSIYAAYALYFFITREWIVLNLKDLTLLILFSSLLFSAVSFTTRTSNMEPTHETIKTLETIKNQQIKGTVFSDPQNGFLIQYYAQRKSYMDELSFLYKGYEEKKQTTQTLYTNSKPKITKKLLDENDISYIYIDQKMQDRLWQTRNQLPLVLELSENFIKLTDFQNRQAWLYIRT